MNSVSGLRWGTLCFPGMTQILRALTDRSDVYRRYVRAGLEIEALLPLSDQQLAARHLTRGEVGRAIFVKHGIPLNRST